jgi:HlyD family secretion protein
LLSISSMPVASTIHHPTADLSRTAVPGRSHLRPLAIRIGVVVAIAGALAAGVMWWRARNQAPAPAYQTAAATRGPLTMSVTATGTVVAWNTVDVGSEVSGKIRSIGVADNDRVTKGQVIAEIDPELLRAQLDQARAARAQAVAQLEQARVTQREAAKIRQRDEALFARGVIAEQELEAATAAAERANAAVTLAAATVRQTSATEHVARTNLAKTTIRSPIDGVVLSHAIEVGQTVVASFQTPVLFRIAEDLRAMKVEVDVDEADVGRIRDGQAARFTVAAYLDRTFDARVVMVHNAARLVDRVVTYRADLAVENARLELRPGMTATAEIIVDELRDALLVPAQALRFAPAGVPPSAQPRVWALRDGQPVALPVTVLGETETLAAIRAELDAGTPIITSRK